MKIKHKFTFTPKNKRNKDLDQQSSVQEHKPINSKSIIQLEEPKEESFHFLSPRKSTKIKSEDDDDIYKTEMNNKKPLELFQEKTNEIIENNKTLELKQKININITNNYDCDNNLMDKSNISGSFSNIIKDQNNSNDKIDETNNSTVKFNTNNTMEESKNNIDNKNNNKLARFCQSMITRKNMAKILNKTDIFMKSKQNAVGNIKNINDNEKILFNNDNINNYKFSQNYNINGHISYLKNLNDKKYNSEYSNIKAKLIKRTPRNNYNDYTNEKMNNLFDTDNKQKLQNTNSRLSFEDTVLFFNKTYNKLNSAFNTSRSYSLIQKKQKTNNQNSFYINSSIQKDKNKIKNLSYSVFIYKKRIIKKDKSHIKDNEIYYEEEYKNNKDNLKNNQLSTKSFRKEKDIINTFRINIKPIKSKAIKNESKLESKKEKPINLKNKNFYSNIYESLLNKQKENCKNNIIIQNFNNYNLNTYNSNKNINPNFINFETYTNGNEETTNKVNDSIKNKRKNLILDIKINKRCFSKKEKKHKKFIL